MERSTRKVHRMDKSQADQLRKQAHTRYDDAVQKAKHDLDRDLEAIERVERLLAAPSDHATSESAEKPQTTDKPLHGQRKRGTLISLIRKAIEDIGDAPFTAADIFPRIEHEYPITDNNRRASVSSTLKRLVDAFGELEVIEQGTGKRYSVYRRKEASRDERQDEDHSGGPVGTPPTDRAEKKDADGLRIA